MKSLQIGDVIPSISSENGNVLNQRPELSFSVLSPHQDLKCGGLNLSSVSQMPLPFLVSSFLVDKFRGSYSPVFVLPKKLLKRIGKQDQLALS